MMKMFLSPFCSILLCVLACFGLHGLAETVSLDDMDDHHSAWGAGELTRSPVRQGVAALSWDPERGALARSDVVCNLSTYHSLRLWVHSRSATFAQIQIVIPSGDGEFVTTFSVDWQGWNRMELPEWRFATALSDRESGWRAARGLTFRQVGTGFEPTRLVLDGLEVSTEWPTIAINDHETLIDWMYRGGNGSHLWHPTAETTARKAGTYGVSRFWSWGTFWVREDPQSRDVCAYERAFGTDIRDYGVLEVRVANDDAGYLSVSLKVDGVWHHPVRYRPGSGRFDAVAMPLPPDGRRLEAVRLDISEPPDAVGGPANREIKCNVHWILLRRSGAPRGDPPEGIGRIAPRPLTDAAAAGGLPGGIYFSRADLPQIRELFTKGAAARLGARIRERADSYCEQEPERYVGRYYPGSNWIVSRVGTLSFDLATCASACALAHVIFAEKTYADQARRALLSLCRIEHWTEGPFARYPLGWGGYGNPFTESGVTYHAALAFDWVYHALAPEERREVQEAILRKGVWWTFDCLRSSPAILKMNQGVVFDSQIGCALIVLAANDASLEPMRRQTADWLWQGIDQYSLRDGASTEGVGYWNYTWNSAVKLLAALAARDPSGFRTRFPENVRRSLDWIVHMKSNAEEGFVPVAICDSRGAMPSAAVSALFATYLDDPLGAWFQQKHGGPDTELAAFMWENETVAVPPNMVPARHFRGAGYVFFREGFDYGDVLFALLGQPDLAGHWQHDRSSFMFEAFGEYLAMDPGMMAYSNPIHRSMSDTRLHNAITIDGRNNVKAPAKVTDFFSSSVLGFTAVNATAAYPGAERMLREALFLRPDHAVIADHVELFEPGRVEWNLNSAGRLALNRDRVVASARNGSLLVDLFTEGTLQLEEENWPCGYPGVTNYHGTMHTGGADRSRWFLASLFPVRRGEEESVQAEMLMPEGGRGLAIRRGSDTELVLQRLGNESCRMLQCQTDARYAYLKLHDGELVAAAMIGGTRLAWKGRTVLESTHTLNAAWDARDGWTAISVQGPPEAVLRVPSPDPVPTYAVLGSVAGNWHRAAPPTPVDGRLKLTVPTPQPPQGGWWLVAGADTTRVETALARPAVVNQTMFADGRHIQNAAFSADELPERFALHVRVKGTSVAPDQWRIRIDGSVPAPGIVRVTASEDGATAIGIAVDAWLTGDQRRPRFFVTHVIEAEARADDLFRSKLSARCRLSVKPRIDSAALFLSDLEPVKAVVHGGVRRDRPYAGDRIRLSGADFPKGLTTHPKAGGGNAHAEVIYDLTVLPEELTRFLATVGVQEGSSGSVTFEVSLRPNNGEWHQVFSTDTLTQTSEPVPVSVPLGEATQLRLLVTDAGDGINSDHAVWAMARFE